MKCDACGTENRDAAKFCKGCGGKLAQAWHLPEAALPAAPTMDSDAMEQPTIVLTGQPLRPAPMPAAVPTASAPAAASPGVAPRTMVLVGGLVVAAAAVAGLIWSQRGDRTPTATAATPSVVAAVAVVTPPGPAPTPTAMGASPAANAGASTEPASVPSPPAAPAAKPARKRAAPKPPPPSPAVEAPPPPAPPPPAPAPAAPPAPQTTCGGLNFIARSRCLAAECAKPGISAHPQCDAVRRQQRIDEEKRNPSGG